MDYLKRAYQLKNDRSDSLIIATITIVSLIIVFLNVLRWQFHAIILIENQVLYIFSVLAQIVGALIGISIAGYALLDSRFNFSSDIDETLKEIIPLLRENQYRWLLRLIVFGLVDIVLCLAAISSYNLSSKKLLILFPMKLWLFFSFIYIY